MEATPISKLGQSFYAPAFEVKVGMGTPPQNLVRDIIEVHFDDSVNKLDSFEITVNNWDAQQQKFKYEPAIDVSHALFEPDRRIALRMGYAGDLHLRLMCNGIITAIEPNYPESGGPTLTIRGQHFLQKAERRQYFDSWKDMRDSDLAEKLGNVAAGGDQPGLGIPVQIDQNARGQEPLEHIEMKDKSPVAFLAERAKRRDYVFYVDGDRLYFGPSNRPGRPEYALRWGASLINFRPTFTVAHQAERVTVYGYDRSLGRKVQGTAVFPRDCNLNPTLPPPEGSHEDVTNPPAESEAAARQRAIEILTQFRRTAVEASGATVGLPDLRAGSFITIDGLGARFNGRYFVTSTKHAIGAGGYTTNFNARRENGS